MHRIGISACPLSESTLHTRYENSPFVDFFQRGLCITLSTDNPMQLHLTNEPLLEEYATAAQVFLNTCFCANTKMWKLSATDMSELARNSVIMSGFTTKEKESWIGKLLPSTPGPWGNGLGAFFCFVIHYRHL